MSGYLLAPVEFLVTTLFQLYILAVLLRFLLQWVRADFYNPLAQFLVKVTNPLLRPLRRVIPGFGGVDLAAVVLMVALQALQLLIVAWLHDAAIGFAALLLGSLLKLVSLLFDLYFFSILLEAILSWINPGYNPVSAILYSLNAPILRPIRRRLPTISGVDLSPLVAILALQVTRMLVDGLFRGLVFG